MKFKVDENLPVEVAETLRQAGHDAFTVLEQGLGGVSDKHIADICKSEQRAIVTLDVGFGDIRTYPPVEHSGIIVLRLKQQDKIHVMEVFDLVVQSLAERSLQQQLWIVDEKQIRIRR